MFQFYSIIFNFVSCTGWANAMHGLKSVGLFDKTEIADMSLSDTHAFLQRAFPNGQVTEAGLRKLMASKGVRDLDGAMEAIKWLGLAEPLEHKAKPSKQPVAAIDALGKAARNTSGLKPIAAEARDLFRRPLMPGELKAFDAVVFDPPRQGAEAQARQLAASRVPLVVGVSCDPATFARDARILVDGGYRLERVVPVDQFLYSSHVELVGVFRR